MVGKSIILSGSQYIHCFDNFLRFRGIQYINQYRLAQYPIDSTVDNAMYFLDHPMGLINQIVTLDKRDSDYLKSSWLSAVYFLSKEEKWDAFIPWLWSIRYMYERLKFPCFQFTDQRPSSQFMPFYLKQHTEHLRQYIVRVNGNWWQAKKNQDFAIITQQIDQMTDCNILTVELIFQDGKWCFLQVFPGIPWGYFVNNPEKIQPILDHLHHSISEDYSLTIPCEYRPFCQKRTS